MNDGKKGGKCHKQRCLIRERLHGLKKGPVINADSEKYISFGAKLELKKGAFSAPYKRFLREMVKWIKQI